MRINCNVTVDTSKEKEYDIATNESLTFEQTNSLLEILRTSGPETDGTYYIVFDTESLDILVKRIKAKL